MLTAVIALTLLALILGLLLGFASVKFKIAAGEVDINRCPPGGESTIQALADLLDVEPKPLDEECGVEKPKMLAVIDEQRCIGCTLCIQACPVDAILGAAKHMHTVIADECTGCELCLEPCPVDCIDMVEMAPNPNTWRWPDPSHVQLERGERT